MWFSCSLLRPDMNRHFPVKQEDRDAFAFFQGKENRTKKTTRLLQHWNAKGRIYFNKVSVNLGRLLPCPERFKIANILYLLQEGRRAPVNRNSSSWSWTPVCYSKSSVQSFRFCGSLKQWSKQILGERKWKIQCVSFLLQSCHCFSLHRASLTEPADILNSYLAYKNPSLNKKTPTNQNPGEKQNLD